MRVLVTDKVRFTELTPALVRIESALLDVAATRTDPDVIWITAIQNGKHMPTSWHYRNAALDFFTERGVAFVDVESFVADLRLALGPAFTVLHEDAGTPNEHVHTQVRKGITYP